MMASSDSEDAEAGTPVRSGKQRANSRPQEKNRHQEKNRQAQQRFRQRQKQRVTELETKVSEQSQRINQLMQEKASIESRCNILIRVVQMRDDQIEQLKAGHRMLGSSSAAGEEEDLADSFKDDLVLTVHEASPTRLSPAQVKSLSRADLVKIWKEYVNQLAVCLVERPETKQHQERVKRLVDEATVLCMRVAITNPVVTKSFVACKLEDSESMDENPEMWLRLARDLNLGQDQRRELAQLRRLFITRLSSIVETRRSILEALIESLPTAIGARHTAMQYLKSHDSMDRLRRTLREEHVLKLDWISTLFKHMLTPTQVAKCIVSSYPYTPDTLAMCSWIAAEDGDQGALSHLTASNNGVLPPALADAVSSHGGLHSSAVTSGITSSTGGLGPANGVLAGLSSGLETMLGQGGNPFMGSGPMVSLMSSSGLPAGMSLPVSTASAMQPLAGLGQLAGLLHGSSMGMHAMPGSSCEAFQMMGADQLQLQM